MRKAWSHKLLDIKSEKLVVEEQKFKSVRCIYDASKYVHDFSFPFKKLLIRVLLEAHIIDYLAHVDWNYLINFWYDEQTSDPIKLKVNWLLRIGLQLIVSVHHIQGKIWYCSI